MQLPLEHVHIKANFNDVNSHM